MFFPNHHGTVPLHTIISLANLDLGIQTCFYNGMGDYAKVWLQLAFPFYVFSIVILIIIASRYFIILQRFTVRRAHSILATLFLLSYTNILHTTSSVLFSYSSISHLPSEHTMLVWSLDANVPLFGVKFILLFVLCLILFLLLVLFTVILLCTKIFMKYKLFNNFLDSFQKPYKLYYWYYWYYAIMLLSIAQKNSPLCSKLCSCKELCLKSDCSIRVYLLASKNYLIW